MLDKLLLTPEEAADVLSIGRTKLYDLIGGGLIETVTIGASRRVPRAALDDYVAALRASGPARRGGFPDGGRVHLRRTTAPRPRREGADMAMRESRTLSHDFAANDGDES